MSVYKKVLWLIINGAGHRSARAVIAICNGLMQSRIYFTKEEHHVINIAVGVIRVSRRGVQVCAQGK